DDTRAGATCLRTLAPVGVAGIARPGVCECGAVVAAAVHHELVLEDVVGHAAAAAGRRPLVGVGHVLPGDAVPFPGFVVVGGRPHAAAHQHDLVAHAVERDRRVGPPARTLGGHLGPHAAVPLP